MERQPPICWSPLSASQERLRLLFQGGARLAWDDEKHPLLSVRLRPDGLVETSHEDGWE